MPSGSRTFQRSSLWSTRRMMLAEPGGRSIAASSRRNPGPNCATGIESPLTTKLILTSAEWPPRPLNSEPVIDIALTNAEAFAARYDLRIIERLGFGIHGTVHVAEHKIRKGKLSQQGASFDSSLPSGARNRQHPIFCAPRQPLFLNCPGPPVDKFSQ